MTEIIWTRIGPGTEAVEIWARTPRKKRAGLRPLYCLIRSVHDGDGALAGPITQLFDTTIEELKLGGHP